MKKLLLCISLVTVHAVCADTIDLEHQSELRYSHAPVLQKQSREVAPTVLRSALKTVRTHPFFTALAFWALFYSRDSIRNHPIVSSMIFADLLSEFALHMLHDDETNNYYDTI